MDAYSTWLFFVIGPVVFLGILFVVQFAAIAVVTLRHRRRDESKNSLVTMPSAGLIAAKWKKKVVPKPPVIMNGGEVTTEETRLALPIGAPVAADGEMQMDARDGETEITQGNSDAASIVPRTGVRRQQVAFRRLWPVMRGMEATVQPSGSHENNSKNNDRRGYASAH